jgi:hypothetical protein
MIIKNVAQNELVGDGTVSLQALSCHFFFGGLLFVGQLNPGMENEDCGDISGRCMEGNRVF